MWKKGDFLMGRGATAPLVAFLSLSRNGAPAVSGPGGSNGGVIATTGVLQCVRCFHHSHRHFGVDSAYASLMEGGSLIKNMERNKSVSGLTL